MQAEILNIQVFDVQTAPEQIWADFISLRRDAYAERDSTVQVPPASVFRKNIEVSAESKRNKELRWLVYDDATEKPVATATTGYITPEHDDYETQKHLASYQIYVDPAFRRRGIGTRLLHLIASTVLEQGRTTLESWVNVDDGVAFQEASGAKDVLKMVTNRLQLAHVDWQMVTQWVEDGVSRNPETTLHLSTQILPDHLLPGLAELTMDVFEQMPTEEASGFPEIVTPDTIRDWQEEVEKMGETVLTLVTEEPDGQISAVTELFWHPEQLPLVWQGLTGVHQQQRRRGLGKWVKAAALLYLRDNVPNAKYIDTSNANVNVAMININQKLGFKYHKQNHTFEIEVADILAS